MKYLILLAFARGEHCELHATLTGVCNESLGLYIYIDLVMDQS